MKAVFLKPLQIFRRGRQLAHDNDQFFLDGENLIGDRPGAGGGADEAESGVGFIDRAVGFDPQVGFGDTAPIHERGLAGIAGLGCDRHLETRRAAT